jgi:hypothetical protein
VVDWGGKVATWFAAVASVSAALAALIAATAKEPLHGWLRILFVALVVIAVVSFVALLLTGPRAIWGWWRKRATPSRATAQPPALVVEIIDSRFEGWRYLCLIAAIRVKITNTTRHPIALSGYALIHDPGEPEYQLHNLPMDEQRQIRREVWARQEDQRYGIPLRNFSMVPTGESITGWIVEAVARGRGGTPLCTIIVKDSLLNEYRAVLPAHQRQVHEP